MSTSSPTNGGEPTALGSVVRVACIAEEVIRRIKRYEALWVARGDEDARRMVDPNHLIDRGVHNQHRTS